MTQKKLTRSLEIDPEEIDRIKALVPVMVEDPLVRAAGKVTEARVLRYALVKGLDVLEEVYEIEERAQVAKPDSKTARDESQASAGQSRSEAVETL